MDAVLDAARGHELHADADAEEGLAALDHLALQGIDHAGHAIEAGAAVGEGADARQHDAVGVGDVARARRHQHAIVHARLARGAFEGFCGGAEVARSVIDDGDGHRWRYKEGVQRTPLVLGTAAAWRGSISTAILSARARPLKQLSTIWWLLSP